MSLKKRIERLQSKKGETLLEVLVATAIFALLTVLMVSLIMGATQANSSALKVQREDMDIMYRLDGVGTNVDLTEENTETTAAPELKITFNNGGSSFDVLSDGIYYTVKGKNGVGVIIKRFVPKTIY